MPSFADIANKLSDAAKNDRELKSVSQVTDAEFSIVNGQEILGVTAKKGNVTVKSGAPSKPQFSIKAQPEQWNEFLAATPKMPYQSYFGMEGMNIHQEGVEVEGDRTAFAQNASIWRRVLELARVAASGPTPEDKFEDYDEDQIRSRYIYVDLPNWGGKNKIFIEQSGSGPQHIVFLHTAGSDSRQFHGVMNDKRMLEAGISMTAFDLPAHGRSFPPRDQYPGEHALDEDKYIGVIAAVIKKLGLPSPIVCGASMAGEICLAVALRYKEVGAFGTIPCQGTDYVGMPRVDWDRDPVINSPLFNPEWVYGMMAPNAPHYNKRLIWHMYSAQVYNCFHGDLDFYFNDGKSKIAWDGRGRVDKIDTKACPVYMLTGAYDWSCTPELSEKTAVQIPGAKLDIIEGLGHFPQVENPTRFVEYLLKAIKYIQSQRK